MARVALLQSLHWPLLGVMHLSSVARQAGHETAGFIVNTPRDLRAVRAFAPDIVALSAQSSEEAWVVETCGALAQWRQRPFVVVGGLLPTFKPQVIETPGVDAICRGEGELPFVELLDTLARDADPAGIESLWVKGSGGQVTEAPIRPHNMDLDALPFPDRELYRRYPLVMDGPLWRVWPVRGCPHSCSYCFHHAYRRVVPGKKYTRMRAVDNVIEELVQIQERYNPPAIWLGGDTFPVHTAWAQEVLARHGAEVGIPFVLSVRIERIDERVARTLADTGCCIGVCFGVESGDEAMRRKLLRREVTDEQILRGAAILRDHGLPVSTTFMMGLPGETFEQALKTVSLSARIAPDSSVCSVYQPLPGTDLAEAPDCSAEERSALSSGELDMFSYGRVMAGVKEARRIERLHRLYFLGSYYPRTIPLLPALSRLPYPPILVTPMFTLMYVNHHTRRFIGWRRSAVQLFNGVRDQLQVMLRRRRAADGDEGAGGVAAGG